MFNDLKENRLFCGLESDEFLDKITDFFTNLNALHPFREGNGRTQRTFINQLAKNAGYELDLN
ncbi:MULTISPECIES: Fic family protein [unclassified Campylobacter]|uniref:Fic family protein n=1 Tax=unclassified Campylobacter TaxID=2593542 RepID=UPI001CC1CC1D|nr:MULTISPECIES: Fic family protein [unclassified Campylobacter]